LQTDTATATSATSVITSVTTDNGGAVKTVTAPPVAATDTSSTDSGSSSDGSSGLNTGQVVGIVVGVIGGVAAIAVVLVCLVVARRKQNAADGEDKGKGRSDMGESRFGVLSPGSGPWGQSGPSAGSRLSEVDPRMDPFKPGLYAARNLSHESFHTIRDEQDYSRPVHQPKVLRATNPDPDVDG
jgi:cell wall integrity and stress response component